MKFLYALQLNFPELTCLFRKYSPLDRRSPNHLILLEVRHFRQCKNQTTSMYKIQSRVSLCNLSSTWRSRDGYTTDDHICTHAMRADCLSLGQFALADKFCNNWSISSLVCHLLQKTSANTFFET